MNERAHPEKLASLVPPLKGQENSGRPFVFLTQLGFTLLELLIGLTLFGFVLALLFGGFRLASRSWDAVESRIERTADEQLGRGFLRQLLTQLQPMRWKKAVGQPMAFAGDSATLRAIAPVSGQAGISGLRAVELAVRRGERAGEPLRLVIRHAPLNYEALQFADSLAEADERRLLDDLEAVSFAYLRPGTQEQAPEWLDTWDDTNQLPRLIRVRLKGTDSGWADLFVRPMIGGSGCRWDSFHQRCR